MLNAYLSSKGLLLFEKLIILLSGIDCSKKNPINYNNLLRSPGQSLDEELDKIRDKILSKFLFVLTGLIVGIIMILIFRLPFYYEIVLLLSFFTYLFFILSKNIGKIRSYKLGRDGEKSVAQYLSIVARQLTKEDANMHVYHDLVDEKKAFNIDHVVVSKKGIFIFETKTYRKDEGLTNTITSNGKELFKNGQKITNNIPLQVKGQVKWLQSELLQKTGKKYTIIPSIVFVGWYVDSQKIDDINITTAKTLKHILENQYRDVLYDDEELKRITSEVHKLATVTNQKYTDICK